MYITEIDIQTIKWNQEKLVKDIELRRANGAFSEGHGKFTLKLKKKRRNVR